MNNNKSEEQELLRLFKCTVDTGTEVLSAFADFKLLLPYGGSFERFLDDKKHQIFHMWQSKKLLCCACPPAGCSFKRTGQMDNWIFKKIYDDSGTEDSGHIVRNRGTVEQLCLHKYTTRNIAIHQLDISATSFLIRNLAPLTRNETTALDTIKYYRGQICHAHSTNSYSIVELRTAWNKLENALVELTEPRYRRLLQRQIQDSQNVNLRKQDVKVLMEKVQEVLDELKLSCNNNVRHLNGMESRLERMSINNTEDIKQHTTEQTSSYAAQAQRAITENIQTTEKKLENTITHEVQEVKELQASSFQKFEFQLHETRSEIKEVKENQEKTQVEILRAIQNLTLSVKYERPYLLVPEETFADSMECPVLWQIATPEDWNLEEVVATLRNQSNKDEQFKKKFVRKGSLIMLTTIAANILNDSEAFEDAVISFLAKMIEDCDIKTEIPGRLDVRLHILNANEVNVTCILPNTSTDEKASQTEDEQAIQTEDEQDFQTEDEQAIQTEGITQPRFESEKFDVAFLNGDSDKEIRWVGDMSTFLKEEYDIKCVIPGYDYLYGFPLKSRLSRYLKKFKAVILTVTRENHTEYYDYIETNEMPIIAVELDYIGHIRWTLWDCTYINCTTCFHLWFPRLIETLKSKLPDHIREGIGNVDGKQEVDCRWCDSIATTPVYHLIDLRRGLSEKKLLFCGSLADEAWLLLLINQMTKVGDPNWIFSWSKQTDRKFTVITPYIVFVLESLNLQKCPALLGYVDYIVKYNIAKVYILKNVPGKSQRFLGNKLEYINATRMDQKELAHAIFDAASRHMNPVTGSNEQDEDEDMLMHDYSDSHDMLVHDYSDCTDADEAFRIKQKTKHYDNTETKIGPEDDVYKDESTNEILQIPVCLKYEREKLTQDQVSDDSDDSDDPTTSQEELSTFFRLNRQEDADDDMIPSDKLLNRISFKLERPEKLSTFFGLLDEKDDADDMPDSIKGLDRTSGNSGTHGADDIKKGIVVASERPMKKLGKITNSEYSF